LGRKRDAFDRRILTFGEIARVPARMGEPNKRILETCVATGARISARAGSDQHLQIVRTFPGRFNPRRPRGQRRRDLYDTNGNPVFQSTLPARAATLEETR